MAKNKVIAPVPTEPIAEVPVPTVEQEVPVEQPKELSTPETVNEPSNVTLPPELEKEVDSNVATKESNESAGASTLTVDKFLFYKMFKTCVVSQGYSGTTAVVKFGAMLGGKTYEEQNAKWKECQEFLRTIK